MIGLRHNDLSIDVETHGDEVAIIWRGVSNERNPSEFLLPYFKESLRSLAGKKCKMDFRPLERINSSTVPAIITFVKDLEIHGIETVINYAKNAEWQAASFKAMETIILNFKYVSLKGL